MGESKGALLVGLSWKTFCLLVPAIGVPWLFGRIVHLGAPGSTILNILCVCYNLLGVASPFVAYGSVLFQP